MSEASVQQSAPVVKESGGSAEIVLGLISYNSAETIRGVIESAQEGLAAHFADRHWVLINADGGSKDGTPELALDIVADKKNFVQLSYPIHPVQKLQPEYYGLPGKANALRAIFDSCLQRNAAACVVVDANLRSMAPDWVEALAAPVLENGVDFVSPCYLRNKYEGTLINGIVYPLTRSLYGKRIQQPAGGEFALSAKTLKHLIRQPQLDEEAAGFGPSVSMIDMWVTIQAAAGGFRLAQAMLGPRLISQNEPAPEVSSMLAQTLGSVLAEMERTAPVWQRVRGSEAVPCFGARQEPAAEPPGVDTSSMVQSFRLGYQNLLGIWRMVLPPATLVALKRMSAQPADTLRFDDVVWAKTIYDFALAWRMRVIDRDHLLKALTPLYMGWVASYINSVRGGTAKEAYERIEALCLAYEAEKGYLISRWRWPDRFNP